MDVVYALEENDDDNFSDDSDYTINSSMESECGMCYPVPNNQQTSTPENQGQAQ